MALYLTVCFSSSILFSFNISLQYFALLYSLRFNNKLSGDSTGVTESKSVSSSSIFSDDSEFAFITLRFTRLWDILSVSQRQFALHLSDTESFPDLTDTPSLYTGQVWSVLPPSVRLKILTAFQQLPDVLEVSTPH